MTRLHSRDKRANGSRGRLASPSAEGSAQLPPRSTEGKPSEPPTVRLVHHSYQPSKAELEQDHRVDATFKEIAKAVTRTVKVEFYKPPKRSR